ncbi:MAG: XRE family transcriptional regulator [Candidatus Electrothrix communis]|nr:MAG: XRE family transcriptional regulator [Candidatus Electrothrix communis]
MPEAFITPHVLSWARKRAQFSTDDAAQRVKVRHEQFLAWEEGKKRPTFRQAQILANAFHVPFGYFFLPAPPKQEPDIPDLRTVGSRTMPGFSLEFLDLYNDILRKQDWFREYRMQEGAQPLPFIGKFSMTDDYRVVAEDIRQVLSVDEARSSARNWEQFITCLIEQVENAGILVMRNSIVGNNTHRPLSVDEFRGFALSDPVAPLIFINSRDAKSAQIFTLAHELVHLWIGQSGVSNPLLNKEKKGKRGKKVETFCNRTAAEVLAPEAQFLTDWNSEIPAQDNIALLAQQYRVSQLVIARRGYDLDVLPYDTLQDFYWQAVQYDQKKKNKLSESPGGPKSDTMRKFRNGNLFSQAVAAAALEGRLLLRDAGSLLGIKPAGLKQYADFLTGK